MELQKMCGTEGMPRRYENHETSCILKFLN